MHIAHLWTFCGTNLVLRLYKIKFSTLNLSILFFNLSNNWPKNCCSYGSIRHDKTWVEFLMQN